ncbi:MAG TPA: hypothetical protein PLQ50_01370 [Candidatus Woesebacteria bacterium]|nr:hypothetical protein [Candidatus Woesebacteria bacterium]
MKRLAVLLFLFFATFMVAGNAQALPIGINAQIPSELDGKEYHYNPENFRGFSVICEGTQSQTGNLHLVVANPPDSFWTGVSCWAYPPSDEKTVNQLVIQFVGDKVKNWLSAKVEPLPIRTINEKEVRNYVPGEIPEAYLNTSAAELGKINYALRVYVQGVWDEKSQTFIASVGKAGQFSCLLFEDKKEILVIDGVREDVIYEKEPPFMWRLTGTWSQDQAEKWCAARLSEQ